MLSRKTTLTILFSAALAAVISAQAPRGVEIPNSPAGQRVAAYLKAFNSGDEKQMREFFSDNVAPASLERRPIDARLQVYREMRDEFQALDLRRVLKADDASITLLLQTKHGGWLEFGFEFEAAPPHMLVGLRVEDTDAPPGASSIWNRLK